MKILVTCDDIREGAIANCSRCPVALALRRDLGEGCNVKVYANRIVVRIGDVVRRIAIPEGHPVREFVKAFDRGMAVQPFSFTV